MTEFHAKYYSHELCKRRSLNDSEKLAPALADAHVDLNPHQIDAALFVFRSPLSKGSILADEVGLGKTIEAGRSYRKNGRNEKDAYYLPSAGRWFENKEMTQWRKNNRKS